MKKPTKAEARRLARIVRHALKHDLGAARWHTRNCRPRGSRYWDDGPCYLVARAISTVDGHRGEIMEVRNGKHAVYVLAGVMMDGYGVWGEWPWTRGKTTARERSRLVPYTLRYHRDVLKRKGACDWPLARVKRSSAPLVRAIRKELACRNGISDSSESRKSARRGARTRARRRDA